MELLVVENTKIVLSNARLQTVESEKDFLVTKLKSIQEDIE